MGKTSNCLKMLQILSSGRVYKGQELADILETNVRNIAEYRTELEMAGYYIEGIPGKYGGYRLITQSVIPTVRLNEAEQRYPPERNILRAATISLTQAIMKKRWERSLRR